MLTDASPQNINNLPFPSYNTRQPHEAQELLHAKPKIKEPSLMSSTSDKFSNLLKSEKVKYGLGVLTGIAGVGLLLLASTILIKIFAGAMIASSFYALYHAYKLGQGSNKSS